MFETIIGLEVHIQLNTKTKLFCSCQTSFNHKQNSNTCPTCLALPGALPTINKEAVKKAIMFGKAINAKVNDISIFDRKNYFYPDSPSSYQISQFYKPIVENGKINLDFKDGSKKEIIVNRAHLEADAGKNIHEDKLSKIDLNRAGTPLIEVVSNPDLRSSEEAVLYLKKLHSIIRYLNISDANMQEGSFRCDANVSIRKKGDEKLYTKVEIKNINSFKFVQKAIDYEVNRQTQAWEEEVYEKEIFQETRLYDANKNETRSMRGKEGVADYRYFPEPDLNPIILNQELKNIQLPELPDEKRDRFIKEYELREYDANILSSSLELSYFFEEMLKENIKAKNAVTWLTVELQGRLEGKTIKNSPVNAKKLAKLIKNIENSNISAKAAKDVLDYLMKNEISVEDAIEKLGLKQLSDDNSILNLIDKILKDNVSKVQEYKSGKDKLFGFFVGQIMKESKGSANPQKVNDLLKKKLS